MLRSDAVHEDRPVAEIPAVEDDQIVRDAQGGLGAGNEAAGYNIGDEPRSREISRRDVVLDEAQFDLSDVRRVDEFERADDRSVESPIVQDIIGRVAAMKQTEI